MAEGLQRGELSRNRFSRFGKKLGRGRQSAQFIAAAAVALAAVGSVPRPSMADEKGISYWLPGSFGSSGGCAGDTGMGAWNLLLPYHGERRGRRGACGGDFDRQAQPDPERESLSASLNANADFVFLAPSYAFAPPVFGGQLAVQVGGLFGPFEHFGVGNADGLNSTFRHHSVR